jgi:hypothetical protein
MLILEYKLTEQEFLDYNYYVTWQSPDRKQQRLRYYVVNIVVYMIFAIACLYLIDNNAMSTSSWIIGACGMIVLLLLMKFRTRSIFDRRARKVLNGPSAENILSQTTLTINEQGLFGKTTVSEVKYNWSAFQKRTVVNNCCYLFISPIQAVVIPLRAISVSEQQELDKLLSQYLPLRADLRGMN